MVKSKPTFHFLHSPLRSACLSAALPRGLRPHLPPRPPPSRSFAFLPPLRGCRVHQALVFPRTFLLWSQCGCQGTSHTFILTGIQIFRLPAVISELSRNENPARLHCTFLPYPATLWLWSRAPEGLWLHFSQHPSPMSNVAFKTRICC